MITAEKDKDSPDNLWIIARDGEEVFRFRAPKTATEQDVLAMWGQVREECS